MKPIRIYASNVTLPNSTKDFYVWCKRGSCLGGGGCSKCVFESSDSRDCTIYMNIPKIYEYYKPSNGYIELTSDSHPELFI